VALLFLFVLVKILGGKPKSTVDTNKPDDKPTLIVDPQGSGPRTIREAVAAAKDGMRIRIKPGVYRESIVLHLALELVGDGPVEQVVLESGDADCLIVHGEQVVVRGLTIRCASGVKNLYYAVDAASGHLLMEDCRLSSNSSSVVGIHGKAGLRATL